VIIFSYSRVYEGYPDFVVDMQANSTNPFKPKDPLQKGPLTMKPTSQSQQINVLDYYETSLGFAPKLYAILQTVFGELVEALKPHNGILMTYIEKEVYDRARMEFKRTRAG